MLQIELFHAICLVDDFCFHLFGGNLMRLRKNYLVGRFVHLKKTQPATTTNVRNAELQISD